MRWVGRQAEEEQLRGLLPGGAVLITGPPGIGKSALASRVDGAVWVDLQGCCTEDDWIARLSVALDANAASRAGVLAAARAHAVVVLDAVDGLGPVLPSWLPDLTLQTQVVLTSRRRLDVDAPQLELGPLSMEDGAVLLRARVQSVQHAQTLDEGALQQLSEALDGVPLALELVAPRLRLHAATSLLARPTDGLDVLVSAVQEARSGASERAREVLDVAAVLPGAFDAEVLSIATGGDSDEALLELLDRSLVHSVPGAVPRFRLLRPVRCAVQPASADVILERLAVGFLPRCEVDVVALDSLQSTQAVRDLGHRMSVVEMLLGHADPAIRLRAALVMAARERRKGRLSAILERDEQVAHEGPNAMRVAWASAVAAAASHFGQHAHAMEAVERVEPLLLTEERPRWRALRAVVWVAAGRRDEGLAEATEVAALGSDDPLVWLRVGMARFYGGALSEAVGPLRRARDEAQSAFRRSQAGVTLAAARRDLGDPADAVAAELALAGPVPDWIAPRADFLRGVVLADQGDLNEARECLVTSAAGMRAQGEPAQALQVDGLAAALGLIDGVASEPVADDGSPFGRAWQAVSLAVAGEVHGAVALARPGLAAMTQRHDRNAPELAAILAVAIGGAHPSLTAELLDVQPSEHRLIGLARQLLQGSEASVLARVEDRIMVALTRRHPSQLQVAKDGSHFVGDNGEAVSIAGRRVLRKVLACLADAEEALGVEALCAQVWPGERLVGESGTRRVHVAVSTLRSLGLRGAIHTVTQADGSTGWSLVAARV